MTLVNCRPFRPAYRPSTGMVRFSDLFEDLFESNFSPAGTNSRPPANVTEEEDHYVLSLSIPGFSKSDIQVNLDGGELIIAGEKKEETAERQGYIRREFNFTRFERRFELPENVESAKISASYENGILHLSLPKKAEASKKAPVSIGIN